jgi:hypothetical protein
MSDMEQLIQSILDDGYDGSYQVAPSDDYHTALEIHLDNGEWFSVSAYGTHNRSIDTQT